MKNASIVIFLLMIVGCTHVPVKVPFPTAPKELLEQPKQLNEIAMTQGKTPINKFLETVVMNYGICHENSIKLSAWQKWYKQQLDLYKKHEIIKE